MTTTTTLPAAPIGRICITDKRGAVSCWPLGSWAELERRIRRTHLRKREAVAYADEPGGRRKIGEVFRDFHDGWTWWCEVEERPKAEGGAA